MTSDTSESFVRDMLARAGVTINGNQLFDIKVHNPHFYRRVFAEGALGLGESYMDGWWDCEALDELISKVLLINLDREIRGNWKLLMHVFKSRVFNLQKISRAYQVGEQHYDAGNDLYRAILDKRMNYTCGYWKEAKTLDEAQEAKLDMVCRKIELEPGMKVLELGCGFGSFAGYAAEKYGVHVTGVTVSKRQVELGRKLWKGLPVELLLKDYRSVSGEYDRVVSIGIMEHIGYKNYRTYMEVVNHTLKQDGIAFIHTIGGKISTTTANPWTTKYIFPNGMLPSIAQLAKAMEGIFIVEDLHNFGPDYDRTLMAWYENFEKAWPELKVRYDSRFYRMWRFYLLSCAGGFRSRSSQLWQIVMTRPGRKQPDCRIG
ncbi:MAG: cyclopropane fatty acyl phospholipid synthase [Acidobacteria bacterium]|nr:cyclopropane fatty acyl phospholipid synthase [Acidobacteriota bacterium]